MSNDVVKKEEGAAPALRPPPSSPMMAQLDALIANSGLSRAAVATACGIAPRVLDSWMEGKSEPTLSQVERVMQYLGQVAVLVPWQESAPYGAHIRDLLRGRDREVYDAQETEPTAVLGEALRLIQTKLVLLEKQWQSARIPADVYRKEFHELVSDLRTLIDAASRTRVVDKWAGTGGDVEFKYGSPRGPGYKKPTSGGKG